MIMSGLPDHANHWERVQTLVEEVLTYDFHNCHARSLRAYALMHGCQKRKEAVEEMRRAIELARQRGGLPEADQWENHIHQWCSGAAHAKAGADGNLGSDAEE